MSTQNRELHLIADNLIEHASKLEMSKLRHFGYRERINIERDLFLLLKVFCHEQFRYTLHGLNEVHRKKLFNSIAYEKSENAAKQFITQIFELQTFLKSLTSENAYVQGDALSRVVQTPKSVLKFIARKLRKTSNFLKSLKVNSY